jgi:hypothetical protein
MNLGNSVNDELRMVWTILLVQNFPGKTEENQKETVIIAKIWA